MEVVDKIEMRNIDEIKPYVRNPRKNNKTVDALCEVIPQVGFNVPIVVDKKGVIVKGHARYAAAIRLGMEKVPCVVSNADEDAIKLDRLTDNKTSELSEWIEDGLMSELDMLNTDIDLASLGFDVETPDLDMDFSEFEEDNTELTKEQYEERLKRFQEMEQSAEDVEIVSEKSIAGAKKKLADGMNQKTVEAYKICCNKCGHIFYVEKDKIVHVAEDICEI